ncbi:hypothetical protein IMZ48_13220 [Candidatus Bathyarchaeota archaeon]|nr:hypothetical protein [Candidatus Bathyarchaeota archaeon]
MSGVMSPRADIALPLPRPGLQRHEATPVGQIVKSNTLRQHPEVLRPPRRKGSTMTD